MVKMLLYVLAIFSVSEYIQKVEQTYSYVSLKKCENVFTRKPRIQHNPANFWQPLSVDLVS